MRHAWGIRDLLEAAVREEQTGAAFYRKMADMTDSGELADFAEEVAEMEDEHEEKFLKMLDKLEEGEDVTGAGYDEMAYMAEGHIFPSGRDGTNLAREAGDDDAMIEQAIQLEQRTLLFYHELKDFIVGDEPEQMLQEVIDEERQHITDWKKYQREQG
jgi:rubrerythrin